MNLVLLIVLSIIGLCITILLGIRLYVYIFFKKVNKANDKILELLNNGLLKKFQENKPYDEVKDEYFKLIDNLEVFSQYVHFSSLRKEKMFDRKGDCLIMQYIEEDGKKFARLHFRAFPLKSLLEKFKPRQTLFDAFRICEETLNEKKELDCIEFITHNKILNESIVKNVIERFNLKLDYTIDNNYKISYLPWTYSEWIMIHSEINPKSKEAYLKLSKINKPIYIKLTRQ